MSTMDNGQIVSPNPAMQGATQPNPTANPNLPPVLQPQAPQQTTHQVWTPQQQAPVTPPVFDPAEHPMVKQLRDEAATYRTRFKEIEPYAKAFEGLSSEEIQAQLSILESMRNPDDFTDMLLVMMDDPDVQSRLNQRRQATQQQQQYPPQQAPTLGQEDIARIIREQLDQRDKQYFEQQQLEVTKAQIIADAKALGYSGDNNDPAYKALLFFMAEQDTPDINRAHAQVMALRGQQQAQQAQQPSYAQPYTGPNGVPASQVSQFVDQFKGKNALSDARKALAQMSRNGQQLF